MTPSVIHLFLLTLLPCLPPFLLSQLDGQWLQRGSESLAMLAAGMTLRSVWGEASLSLLGEPVSLYSQSPFPQFRVGHCIRRSAPPFCCACSSHSLGSSSRSLGFVLASSSVRSQHREGMAGLRSRSGIINSPHPSSASVGSTLWSENVQVDHISIGLVQTFPLVLFSYPYSRDNGSSRMPIVCCLSIIRDYSNPLLEDCVGKMQVPGHSHTEDLGFVCPVGLDPVLLQEVPLYPFFLETITYIRTETREWKIDRSSLHSTRRPRPLWPHSTAGSNSGERGRGT